MSRKQPLYLLIGIVIFTLLLFSYGYYYHVLPVKKEADNLTTQLEIQKRLLDEQKTEENAISTSTNLQRQLPVKKAIDQLLVELSNIEDKTNNIITNFVIDNNSSTITDKNSDDMLISDQLKKVGFELEVTAPDYRRFRAFLTELDQLERIINIHSFQFGSGSNNIMTYSVSFSAYYNPSFEKLLEEAPVIDYEEPAQKTVPLERFN
ncbi:type 4a pilus biogenesis protein PilO [Aquibacillus albus]|uniref:Type IV pilus assembly protein PilO n=1 Tax=Aquibacillus albus TaxID=1168171 RepID=A0ABS2N1P1_9BACI|nr:type 4a pilus biogenesis protein PilO [Aquibacillus albus]MBM7572024.1 type IV pilus assembly protein PilO [Aquibacillus albus]